MGGGWVGWVGWGGLDMARTQPGGVEYFYLYTLVEPIHPRWEHLHEQVYSRSPDIQEREL